MDSPGRGRTINPWASFNLALEAPWPTDPMVLNAFHVLLATSCLFLSLYRFFVRWQKPPIANFPLWNVHLLPRFACTRYMKYAFLATRKADSNNCRRLTHSRAALFAHVCPRQFPLVLYYHMAYSKWLARWQVGSKQSENTLCEDPGPPAYGRCYHLWMSFGIRSGYYTTKPLGLR